MRVCRSLVRPGIDDVGVLRCLRKAYRKVTRSTMNALETLEERQTCMSLSKRQDKPHLISVAQFELDICGLGRTRYLADFKLASLQGYAKGVFQALLGEGSHILWRWHQCGTHKCLGFCAL